MASDRAKRSLASMVRQGLTESVIYRPSGGTARTIDAVVDRPGPQQMPGSGQPVRSDRIEITVLNDATLGISRAEINGGADTLDIARAVGGAAATRALGKPTEEDADWLKLPVN
jgi:hypothetical protein